MWQVVLMTATTSVMSSFIDIKRFCLLMTMPCLSVAHHLFLLKITLFIAAYILGCYEFRLLGVQVEWPMKLQISHGVIRGMNYLHTKDPQVVHADLKVQNVLVGDAYKAKVNAVFFVICFFICEIIVSL